MAKKVINVTKKEVECSNVSFSGGKMIAKQNKNFVLIIDVPQEQILAAAASTWVIELQGLRDKEGADEKVRNLPNVINVSDIGSILGKGARMSAMSEAQMVAKLLGCDVEKVTPEMIALVKSIGKK